MWIFALRLRNKIDPKGGNLVKVGMICHQKSDINAINIKKTTFLS